MTMPNDTYEDGTFNRTSLELKLNAQKMIAMIENIF